MQNIQKLFNSNSMLKEYKYLREALPKNIRFEDRVRIKTYNRFKIYGICQVSLFNTNNKAYTRYIMSVYGIVKNLSKVMMYNHF